ncbi:recombinase family protein [Streptococcus pluranimalium]|uniref:Recombinase family protein n=1 Tax=Helcococcus bovis TaxID=3153252 RepID=A0ABW9F7Q0_9FIRM|nr:recombinase family protein [Streptococcus agalactiae]HEM2695141.1 recombinase family protein [Streptococcus suis]HEQ7722660.1 recombinase family protein [Streptococcus pyogenes]KAF1268396.1 hypothetical protein B8V77_04235 [Streptococcus agalactiae]RRA51968.1 recombinase [Streptococcus agalactiae]HEM2696533.1 recombinase family protein [Streptococcus suis]
MKHLPKGYKIENGKIIVSKEEALKIQSLFEKYLEGFNLVKAAETVGIKGSHGTISRILENEKYIGALNYPPIISKEIFEKVQTRRSEIAKKLGRDNFKEKVKDRKISLDFIIEAKDREFDDPYEESSYKYSLIKIGGI